MRMVCLAVLGLALMPLTVNSAISVLKENKVTVTAQDAELTGVLKSMFAEAGVSCTISPEVKGLVTCDIRERPIDEALRAILSPKGYTWRREGEVYSVVTRPVPKPEPIQEKPREEIASNPQPVDEPLTIDKIPLNFMDAAQIRDMIMGNGANTTDPRTFGGVPGVAGAYPVGGIGTPWSGGFGYSSGGMWGTPGGTGYGYPGYSGYPGYRGGYSGGYPNYRNNQPRYYSGRRY